jgi:threonyl-tRNA synthetase
LLNPTVLAACAQFIREKYWEYEYEEVVTPNLFNFELWTRSGHADHYRDNMFVLDVEDQEFGLKPMNCPGARRLTPGPG